jgi:hypothetical protein
LFQSRIAKFNGYISKVWNRFLIAINNAFPTLFLKLGYMFIFLRFFFSYLNIDDINVRVNVKYVTNQFPVGKGWHFYDSLCKFHIKALIIGNRSIEKQVYNCSLKLKAFINNYTTLENRKLLLYPMHVYSDEFPILIAERAVDNQLIVISDVKQGKWEDKWGEGANEHRRRKIENLRLFNPFELNKNDAAREIRNIIKQVRKGEASFSVFPDAIPEYTLRLGSGSGSGSGHSYKRVSLFDKEACLHQGPFNYPKLMRTDVLPYYVFIEKGKIRLKIMEPIKYEDIDLGLPQAIQCAIDEQAEQWMLWHFPSFFYRNG